MRKIIFVLGMLFSVLAFAGYDEGMAAYKAGDYQTALKELLPLAMRGDDKSQEVLGVMYGNGKGVSQDFNEAAKWFRLSADQGNAHAQENLGKMYSSGKGVLQDDKEAIKWFHVAADQGYDEAQNSLGWMYGNGKGVIRDDKESVKWIRLAADQGLAVAQSNLALMYLQGKGVSQDDKEAVRWLHLAADQGYAVAQRKLGLMYLIGRGTPQDENEAAKWLHLAADQGDTDAKGALAKLPLYQGMSDEIDKAYELKPPTDASSPMSAVVMMKAVLSSADYLRGLCIQLHSELQPEIDMNLEKWKSMEAHAIIQAETHWATLVAVHPELEKMENLSSEFGGLALKNLERTDKSENGIATQLMCKKTFADFASGIWRNRTPKMYKFLDEMPQSIGNTMDKETLLQQKAKNDALLLQQAENGDANAQDMLGLSYESGWGMPKDDAQAFKWFSKAAAQGSPNAQYSLGQLYEKGQGVPKDENQAIDWYRKAAEQGLVMARSRLRAMFIEGQLIPTLDDHSGKWWQKLVEQADMETHNFSMLRTAADRGAAVDQVNLGLAYLTGIGTPKDRDQAIIYFRKAAEQGQTEAQCLLAAINASDRDWKVPSANTQVFDKCHNAADDGYADTQFLLGILYKMGRGTPKDEAQAFLWVRKAADQGRSDAQWQLGYMYEKGIGVAKDESQANIWYRKAADNSYQPAMMSLALNHVITQLTSKSDDQVEKEKNVEIMNLAAEHAPDNARELLTNLWSSGAYHEHAK